MSTSFCHQPVLANEVIDFLRPHSGSTIIDGTLGGGGHSALLLNRGARVIAFDRDPDALAYTREHLGSFGPQFITVEENFSNAPAKLLSLGVSSIDGLLLDLGVSSYQLDTASRGFSFQQEGPLDMRMGNTSLTAADLVNTAPADELARIFYEYGDEPHAKQLVNRIVRAREKKLIRTTTELAQLISKGRYGARDPRARIFQALRIAVNDELGSLKRALPLFAEILVPGGRMAIITFHSLEDRIVKNFFRQHSIAEIDHPAWASSKPNPNRIFNTLTPRSLTPSAGEIIDNPRSRSARLRVVERRVKKILGDTL